MTNRKQKKAINELTLGKCLTYIRDNSCKPFSKSYYVDDTNGNVDYLAVANDAFQTTMEDDELLKEIGYWEIIDGEGMANKSKNEELIDSLLEYNGMKALI